MPLKRSQEQVRRPAPGSPGWLVLASFDRHPFGLTARNADLFRTAGLAHRHRDAEDTLLEAGVDLVSINGFGEGDAALKRAFAAFLDQPVDSLVGLDRGLELAFDGQGVLLRREIKVFRLHSWQHHTNLIALLGLKDIHRDAPTSTITAAPVRAHEALCKELIH